MTINSLLFLSIILLFLNLTNSTEIQQNVTNKKLKNNEFMGQKILPDFMEFKNLGSLDEMDENTKSLEKFLAFWDYFKHESYDIRTGEYQFSLI